MDGSSLAPGHHFNYEFELNGSVQATIAKFKGGDKARMHSSPTHAPIEENPASPKRLAIVAAAAETFLDHGYGAASMDEIARRAGVSKATVYAHFKGKDALFGAIVAERCHKMMTPQESLVEPSSPEAMLYRVGRGLIEVVCVPSSIALYRVVLAEAVRFPELGRVFFELGLRPAQERLAAYLAGLAREGAIAVDDPVMAAKQFLGMALNDLDIRLLLGITTVPDESARDAMARSAVSIFLDGCRQAR